MVILDRVIGIALILIGSLFCIASLRLGIGKLNSPGPGFLPLIAGGLLILLSLGTISEGRHVKHAESTPRLFNGKRSAVPISVLISLLVYSLVLDSLGFLLATFFMLILLFSIWKKQRLTVVLGASVLTTVLTYLFFGSFLKITLPTGFLGF
jgi:hypothetical protein